MKIQNYQDLYYATKIYKELRDAKNPKFIEIRDRIRLQIEDLVF
jgi:hypothetical protein